MRSLDADGSNIMIKPKRDRSEKTENQKRSEAARERLKKVIATLIEQQDWPEGITARFSRLCKMKFSGQTLYKNKDLWHPGPSDLNRGG